MYVSVKVGAENDGTVYVKAEATQEATKAALAEVSKIVREEVEDAREGARLKGRFTEFTKGKHKGEALYELEWDGSELRWPTLH